MNFPGHGGGSATVHAHGKITHPLPEALEIAQTGDIALLVVDHTILLLQVCLSFMSRLPFSTLVLWPEMKQPKFTYVHLEIVELVSLSDERRFSTPSVRSEI